MQPAERVHLGAYVDRELAERRTERAREHDRSASGEIRRAVAEHVASEDGSQCVGG